jgi:type II secretory pathway pseudopilin PulG
MITYNKYSRFTLVELLVVCSILAILLSLLFPSIHLMIYKSRLTVCATNIKQFGVVTSLYVDDNYSLYPSLLKYNGNDKKGRNNSNNLGYHAGGSIVPLLETVNDDPYKLLSCPSTPTNKWVYKNCLSIWFDVNGRGAIVSDYPPVNRSKMMMREGDTFTLNHIKDSKGNKYQGRIIANDRIQRRTINSLNDGCPGNRRILTNHYKPSSYKVVFENKVWRGYAEGDANYLLDDGSVHTKLLIPKINSIYGATKIQGFANTGGMYEESFLPYELLIKP